MQTVDSLNVELQHAPTCGKPRSKKLKKIILYVIFAPFVLLVVSSSRLDDRRRQKAKERRDAEHAARRAQVCPPSPAPHVAESKTNAAVTIERRLTVQTSGKCHHQQQSPLFSKIPPEIRNEIFAYAATPHDDPRFTYKPTDYWYRPGHHARRFTSPAMLLTCRRIWLEANQYHIRQGERAEHCFYFDHRPDWAAALEPYERAALTRTLSNRHAYGRPRLYHVHLFAHMGWFERDLPSHTWLLFTQGGPEVLTITIKHTNWPGWENDAALRFNTDWLAELVNIQPSSSTRLREIRLELETLEYKVDQLRGVVDQIHQMRKGQDEGKHGIPFAWELQDASESPPECAWIGSTRIGGQSRSIYADRKKLDYRVVTLVWKSEPASRRSTGQSSDMKQVRFSHHRVASEVSAIQDRASQPKSRKVLEWEERWRAEGSLLKFAD